MRKIVNALPQNGEPLLGISSPVAGRQLIDHLIILTQIFICSLVWTSRLRATRPIFKQLLEINLPKLVNCIILAPLIDRFGPIIIMAWTEIGHQFIELLESNHPTESSLTSHLTSKFLCCVRSPPTRRTQNISPKAEAEHTPPSLKEHLFLFAWLTLAQQWGIHTQSIVQIVSIILVPQIVQIDNSKMHQQLPNKDTYAPKFTSQL